MNPFVVSGHDFTNTSCLDAAAAGHAVVSACLMTDLVSTAGAEPPGQTQVLAPAEPAAGKRREAPAAARSVRHRHSSAAPIYSGDQDQKHDLQDQTQAGLHSNRLRRKVMTLSEPQGRVSHRN